MLVYIGREYGRGLSMVERGVALNPNLAVAWSMLGWVSVICGQPERAIESFEKMIRLIPLDPLRMVASLRISGHSGSKVDTRKGGMRR